MRPPDYVAICEISQRPIIAVVWQRSPGYGMIAWIAAPGNAAGIFDDGEICSILGYWPDFYIDMAGMEANSNYVSSVRH